MYLTYPVQNPVQELTTSILIPTNHVITKNSVRLQKAKSYRTFIHTVSIIKCAHISLKLHVFPPDSVRHINSKTLNNIRNK